MRFNLPSSAKLWSLQMILLKCGACSVLYCALQQSHGNMSRAGLTATDQMHKKSSSYGTKMIAEL